MTNRSHGLRIVALQVNFRRIAQADVISNSKPHGSLRCERQQFVTRSYVRVGCAPIVRAHEFLRSL
jgi:hypothetical protein